MSDLVEIRKTTKAMDPRRIPSLSTPLPSVVFVLRHQSNGDALQNLGVLICNYLGPSPNLSLHEALSYGSIALINWIWSLSCTSVDSRTSEWTLCNYLRSDPHYSRWQFDNCMEMASIRGDMTLLTWLLGHFPYRELKAKVAEAAATRGHVHVLEFLLDLNRGLKTREEPSHKKRKIIFSDNSGQTKKVTTSSGISVDWSGEAMDCALESRQYEVVRWLYEHGLCGKYGEKKAKIACRAFETGGEDFTNFMRGDVVNDYVLAPEREGMIVEYSIDIDCAESAFPTVAKLRNLELMQQLVQLHSPLPKDHMWLPFWELALTDACRRGDLHVVKWLDEHWIGRELRSNLLCGTGCMEIISAAVQGGQIDVLEYLHRQKYVDKYRNGGIMIAAINHNHLSCVKWLFQHGWRADTDTNQPQRMILTAAKSGRLDLLKYFQSMDTLPEYHNSRGEVRNSNLPMKFLWSKGLAMATAASYGHMDVVQWLHANDLAGSTFNLAGNAAKNGHLGLLQWIHANRPEDMDMGQALDRAASSGHLEIVKWLVSVSPGASTTYTMDHVAAEGDLDMLKWLHKNTDAQCTVRTMDSAAANGHLDLVRWLHENTDCGCTVSAMDMAAAGRHLDVVKWLHANRSEGCSIYAVQRAAQNADLRMITWLHAHFPQHIPTRLDSAFDMCDSRLFDMMIFLHVHYKKLYTVDFVDMMTRRVWEIRDTELYGWLRAISSTK